MAKTKGVCRAPTGERIRSIRVPAGLGSRELSGLIGRAHSYIGMVERQGVEPSGKLLVAIARVLGASPAWLADGEGERPTTQEVHAAVERARAAASPAVEPEATHAPTEPAAAE